MSHKQIGKEDWSCISRMLRASHSFKEIARTLGKDKSSIGRHVKQYGGRDSYDVFEVRCSKRMKRVNAMQGIRIIKGDLLRKITKELKDHKSPEQIAGVFKRKKISVVASTIYRYIKERAPHLKQFLRSQKGKYRRKRGTKERAAKKIQESLGDYNRGEFTISSLEDFVKETKKETKTGYYYNLFSFRNVLKKQKQN